MHGHCCRIQQRHLRPSSAGILARTLCSAMQIQIRCRRPQAAAPARRCQVPAGQQHRGARSSCSCTVNCLSQSTVTPGQVPEQPAHRICKSDSGQHYATRCQAGCQQGHTCCQGQRSCHGASLSRRRCATGQAAAACACAGMLLLAGRLLLAQEISLVSRQATQPRKGGGDSAGKDTCACTLKGCSRPSRSCTRLRWPSDTVCMRQAGSMSSTSSRRAFLAGSTPARPSIILAAGKSPCRGRQAAEHGPPQGKGHAAAGRHPTADSLSRGADPGC